MAKVKSDPNGKTIKSKKPKKSKQGDSHYTKRVKNRSKKSRGQGSGRRR